MTDIDFGRLSMSVGEAMFTQRAIRRLRPDPIPVEDLRLVIEAAVKAPNGGNAQPTRFVVLTDQTIIREFGALYKEAWWAKRRDEGRPWTTREAIPPEAGSYRFAAKLADEIGDAPCIVLAFSASPGGAGSVLPAVQNLMLAARALGIGSVLTTLHADVLARLYALLGVPLDAEFHHCIPLGYPRGAFGPTQRRPTAETTFWNRWDAPPPWG